MPEWTYEVIIFALGAIVFKVLWDAWRYYHTPKCADCERRIQGPVHVLDDEWFCGDCIAIRLLALWRKECERTKEDSTEGDQDSPVQPETGDEGEKETTEGEDA